MPKKLLFLLKKNAKIAGGSTPPKPLPLRNRGYATGSDSFFSNHEKTNVF